MCPSLPVLWYTLIQNRPSRRGEDKVSYVLTAILNGGGLIELVMSIISSFGLSETIIAQTSIAVVLTATISATGHMYMQIVKPIHLAQSGKRLKHCVYNIMGKR